MIRPAIDAAEPAEAARTEERPKAVRLGDLMVDDVCFVTMHDPVAAAAHHLTRGDCDVVPVIDQEARVRGMLAEHDICMAAYAKNLPLSELAVEAAMARGVVACRADDSPGDALRTMVKRRVRRLPIVNEDGVLLGVISLDGLAGAAASGLLDAQAVVAAVAAINSHPAGPEIAQEPGEDGDPRPAR